MKKKLSLAGFLITLGVVYGDIGTSPLYVMKSIVEGQGGFGNITEEFMIGTVSLILWTVTLLTTIKYVCIALRADNHGEGGIFSLYTLVRNYKQWLIIPAMIGGAALLADGVLTPAVTVTTAIEGLKNVPAYLAIFGHSQTAVIVITVTIIALLFLLQRFGTEFMGKIFGPAMFLWFTFLLVTGIANINTWTILQALNPYHAIHLLLSPQNKEGIFILGSIFLATTGAEALYSDMGHVGKENIYFSWPYVKISLIASYMGQACWIIQQTNSAQDINPFFGMLPTWMQIPSILFATLAAIIASQALISGSYTLVSEAIKLKFLPRLKILYPGDSLSQMYIPAVNHLLWICTTGVVLGFQTSHAMESAYGLSITVTMLMTTLLLHQYLIHKAKINVMLATLLMGFFSIIEVIFFISSVAKFFHGGYVAVCIALVILGLMTIWVRGNQLVDNSVQFVDLNDYKEQLQLLHDDINYPLYQTNVVFLTNHMKGTQIEKDILYSILDKNLKKAKTYWFIEIKVTNSPFTREYEVDMLGTDFIVKVTLYLGFRVSQDVNIFLREIVSDLITSGELPVQPQQYSTIPNRNVGDFRFIILRESIPNTRIIPKWDRQILQLKLWIKQFTTTPEKWFGLEFSEVTVETVPLTIGTIQKTTLQRRGK